MKAENPQLIVHVDVDAFFASVEQLLIPSLRGRPVVVGSGVIASCSYEARRFGLRAGMSLHEARRLCPSCVFLKGDYQIYRCFAEHVWNVCRRYTTSLETFLDEAYGDATGIPRGSPLAFGRRLREDVRREVGLPVSVGLARNRMLAKLASGSVKPRGVAWVSPGEEQTFLAPLPIGKLPGVGRATAERLADMNVKTVSDLRAFGRKFLSAAFGRRGEVLYERCRGREGHPNPSGPGILPASQRVPRTISRETTFHQPQCDPQRIRGMLFYLLERAMRTVRARNLLTRSVEVSIRYEDFRQVAARRTLDEPTDDDEAAFHVVLDLLERLHTRRVALRHVGIVLSRFVPDSARATLFEPRTSARRRELHGALDAIRDRYGHAAVVAGKSIELLGSLEQNDYGFVLRTPSLTK